MLIILSIQAWGLFFVVMFGYKKEVFISTWNHLLLTINGFLLLALVLPAIFPMLIVFLWIVADVYKEQIIERDVLIRRIGRFLDDNGRGIFINGKPVTTWPAHE